MNVNATRLNPCWDTPDLRACREGLGIFNDEDLRRINEKARTLILAESFLRRQEEAEGQCIGVSAIPPDPSLLCRIEVAIRVFFYHAARFISMGLPSSYSMRVQEWSNEVLNGRLPKWYVVQTSNNPIGQHEPH